MNYYFESKKVSLAAVAAVFAAVCNVVGALQAHAQSEPPAGSGSPTEQDTVTVGIGVGVTPSYDGARKYKIIPGGFLGGTVSGHDFQLNGPQLFIDAIPNDRSRKIDFELGPVIGVSFNRNGTVSDPRVSALGKLKTAVEFGARGSVGLRGVLSRTDKLALTVTGVWDVAGAHRSYLISPSIAYSTLAGRRTFLSMAIKTEFTGDRYAAYNFGISNAGAAASGLAAYTPRGGLTSVGGNVLATHALGNGGRKGWALFGIASYKRLRGDIAKSPIVISSGSPNQFFASAGLAYTF